MPTSNAYFAAPDSARLNAPEPSRPIISFCSLCVIICVVKIPKVCFEAPYTRNLIHAETTYNKTCRKCPPLPHFASLPPAPDARTIHSGTRRRELRSSRDGSWSAERRRVGEGRHVCMKRLRLRMRLEVRMRIMERREWERVCGRGSMGMYWRRRKVRTLRGGKWRRELEWRYGKQRFGVERCWMRMRMGEVKGAETMMTMEGA
ncbi:hypothetical protein BDZ91DRAFT_736084 [Kalaharituber pfeilii]|nr:hypothetical protein BDZ91DRAFT_736084 [Kalaharituber pfeilii]